VGRHGGTRIALAAGVALILLDAASSFATIRYGDVQISGNIETQTLFRLGNSFDFDPVQLRNTLRLQYEHKLANEGAFFGDKWKIPGVRDVDFFAYYRGVYDGIYDISPGGNLATQDGSSGGSLDDIPKRSRNDLAWENVLREIYVDVNTRSPFSFRIGRQQIIWGTALNFRALDQHNALDLTWHFQQEAGLLGRVGFSELRVPHWAIKVLGDFGTIGPFSNIFAEAYEMPFGFNPTKLRFLPAPWGIPLRYPLRGGLVIDAAEAFGAPVGEGLVLLQPCFDTTGNTQPNATADVDFSRARETGLCPSGGIEETTFNKGHYDRHDPSESHQLGARVGALAPLGLEFTLNYIYRRAPGLGLPGSSFVKTQLGTLAGTNALNMLQIPDIHDTTDPITGETTNVLGYVRVPIEFYYPYVHIFGLSLNYPENWSGSVLNLELTWMEDIPSGNADPVGNGVKKKDFVVGAFNIDRQTWIRPLNKRTTFTTVFQANFVYNTQHEDFRVGADGQPYAGDIGTPSSTLIPRLYGDLDRIDKANELELLTLFVITTFYKGGTVVPLFGWISDWGNAPSMEFLFLVDWYLTNNFFIEPGLRIFTNFGRNVDDPFGIGRLSEWDEFQLKATWQF
jgi:hypothetical protein